VATGEEVIQITLKAEGRRLKAEVKPGSSYFSIRPSTFVLGQLAWLFLCVLCALCVDSASAVSAISAQTIRPRRIISLVPNVTEMLFAIGAGPQVVGVGSFDTYPPEVSSLPRVGGLLDPDVERILSLKPDLVVVYGTQSDLRRQLERARIDLFPYQHGALATVTKTMRALGDRVGRRPEAERVAADVEARLAAVRRRVAGRPRRSTLLVFGREARALRGIYASGGWGFLHDMIEIAGGRNVFADVRREAVQTTTELILARAPEVILELRSALEPDDLERERAVWTPLASVPAVRSGRVYILVDPALTVPGPRIAAATELIARTIHPEAWGDMLKDDMLKDEGRRTNAEVKPSWPSLQH
jgi:iron complex transport system substrate-binding protein